MKLVKLTSWDGEDCYVSPRLIKFVRSYNSEQTTIHFAGDDDTSLVKGTPAEVAAAIEAATGGEGKEAHPLTKGLVPWWQPVQSPVAEPAASSPPSPAPPVPLAVGQVWENTARGGLKEDMRVRITLINEVLDRIEYEDVTSGYTSARTASSFRDRYPDLVSPAPEPVTPPSPQLDPVALLAEGKRLRFVRDAGPISKRIPATIFAEVTTDFAGKATLGKADGSARFAVGVIMWSSVSHPYFDGQILTSLCLEHMNGRRDAAKELHETLSDLGYRFHSVVTDSDSAD